MKKKLIFGLIFLLLAFGFLEAQYHFFLKANRYWSNAGDFSTDGRITSIGAGDNGLRLAYSGGRYTDIIANDEGELEITKVISRDGEGESTICFDTTWSGKDESRQGIINIWGQRDTAITSWGGSPEMGIKMTMRNEVVHGVGTYHMRGMEIVAANRSDDGPPVVYGTMGDIVAAYFSAESWSGTESTNIRPLWVIYNQSGNVNTEHTGIFIQDNSQSNVGTNYGIKLTTTNYNQVREYGYFLDSLNGSWTNGISLNGTITYAFDFENTNGTNAAWYSGSSYTQAETFGSPDGFIRVDIGGNILYIYVYGTLPT